MSIKDRDLFEDMLAVCQVRGRDATGVIRVDRKGEEYTYAKALGTPSNLLNSRQYDLNIRKIGVSALVGHCRHKTVGDNTIRNAHPFEIEERGIVGVHNGTLKNYYRFDEHRTGMTDSQLLYELIASRGPEEAFAEVEGAYACVWWDSVTSTLNFIRNSERPLYFTFSEDQRRLYWASEPWMFGTVYRKEKLWDGGVDKQVYRSLEEDILYCIEIDANAPKDKPVFKIKEGKKIVKKPRPTVGIATTTTTNTWSNRGGEVANPFRSDDLLNDDLPQHLRVSAKQENNPTKLGTTSKSSGTSSTNSKNSQDQSKQSTSSETSSSTTNSPTQQPSTSSAKTSKGKLSVVSRLKQSVGLSESTTPDLGKTVYQPNVGTDVRYIRAVDTEYITDRRTGREVDEHQFHRETGGKCCHCGNGIRSLIEVAEIFDKGKRFICGTCVTPRADPHSPITDIKECA